MSERLLLSFWDVLNSSFVSTLLSTIFGGLVVMWLAYRLENKGELVFNPANVMMLGITPTTTGSMHQVPYDPESTYDHVFVQFPLDIYNSSKDTRIIRLVKFKVVTTEGTERVKAYRMQQDFESFNFPAAQLTHLVLHIYVHSTANLKKSNIYIEYQDEKNALKSVLLYSDT